MYVYINMGIYIMYIYVYIRPPLKKLFPVHRPTGLIRAYYNVFSMFQKKSEKGKKESLLPDWPSFSPLGKQETSFHLRVA